MNRLSRLLSSLRRPYRAAAQLDALPDGEGQALVRGLAKDREARGMPPLLAWPVGLLGSLAATGVLRIAFPPVVAMLAFFPMLGCCWLSLCVTGPRWRSLLALGLTVAVFAALFTSWLAFEPTESTTIGRVVAGCAAAVVASMAVVAPLWLAIDALSLRRAVEGRLRMDWCQWCAYPLHELPACTGPMECPKCGRPCIAAEFIRTAADLLACDVESHAAQMVQPRPKIVERCSCGYPLRGLPVAGATVRCPECGKGYHICGTGFIEAITQDASGAVAN